jgi:hypothetical protein
MHERTFGQFARVLIDIDLLQPLRYKLLVERKGFAFFVDLEYEHIPAFCTECKMIGHNLDNCKRWNMEELRITKDNNIKHKAPETKKIYVQAKDGRPQQAKSKEVINVETINVEDVNQPVLNIIESSNHEVEPSKQPVINNIAETNTANAGSSSHEQGDCVPVLCPVEPGEMLRMQDRQLEAEINEGSDDGWSTDSQESFVNNTQLVENEEQAAGANDHVHNNSAASQQHLTTPLNPIVGETSKFVENNQLPERVIKDMAFLKESWANMTEADEAAQQNVADDTSPMDSNDVGFQIHMSKQQKKAQKKLKQSSRDSYATRSKVPLKPFR